MNPAVSGQPTREVGCHLELDVLAPARLVLQVAVADGPTREVERLEVTCDGAPGPVPREVPTTAGGRLHVLDVGPGRLGVDYRAVVSGAGAPAAPAPDELFGYLRPSRYCESDKLLAVATRELVGDDPATIARSATAWVGTHLAYVTGSSRGTDSAVDTLLAASGVCRDYAHLLVALLRARDVPARLVGVYAPGASPMDHHAVVEAWLGDGWYVFDATALAPRHSLVRVATGRDAADTAFLTTHGGGAQLIQSTVTAVAWPALPVDDGSELVVLG